MPALCILPWQRMFATTHQVHVWYAPLDIRPSEAARIAEILSPDERSRATRLRPSFAYLKGLGHP